MLLFFFEISYLYRPQVQHAANIQLAMICMFVCLLAVSKFSRINVCVCVCNVCLNFLFPYYMMSAHICIQYTQAAHIFHFIFRILYLPSCSLRSVPYLTFDKVSVS